MTHTGNDNRKWWLIGIIGIIILSVITLASFGNAEKISNEQLRELNLNFEKEQLQRVKDITYERAFIHSVNASLPDLTQRQSFCIDPSCLELELVEEERFSGLGSQLERLERTQDFLHRTYATAILKENIDGETKANYQNALKSVTPNITNSSGFSYPLPTQYVYVTVK